MHTKKTREQGRSNGNQGAGNPLSLWERAGVRESALKRVKNARKKFVARLACSLLSLAFLLSTTASYAAESITFYHWDALGSPVASTDSQGNIKWREQYRPYGERIQNQSGAQNNARWYTGHPHDNATGLTYAGARYYDPIVGRFMGADPKAFSDNDPFSFNRYAYGNDNPYKFFDPDGNWAIPVIIAFIAEGINLYLEATSPPPPGCGDCIVPSTFGTPGPPAARGAAVTEKIVARSVGSMRGAHEVAKEGGRHAGFLKNYLDRSPAEVQKAISSLEKQIAEHESKIADPRRALRNWDSLDPRQQEALLKQKWPSDIQRLREQSDVLRGLLGGK